MVELVNSRWQEGKSILSLPKNYLESIVSSKKFNQSLKLNLSRIYCE